MNLSKQVNMFTETLVLENVEGIKEQSSAFDLDFDLGKLSVSPILHEGSCLGADESSTKMITSDVSGEDLISAFDSISFDKSLELHDSVIKNPIKSDNFDACEADLHQKDASAIDVYDSALPDPSSHSNRNGETEVLDGETLNENHPLIVYRSSRRRSARNNKLNQNNNESQNLSGNCRRSAPKKCVLEFNALQISKRRRSLFSKRSRSSVWGSRGNILPDFGECSGLDLNTGKDKKPKRARGVKGNQKTTKDHKDHKSKAKASIPTGRISLKIKFGNQRCDIVSIAENSNASQKSVGEVVTGDVVLQNESNLEKISSNASNLSTHLDFTGIPEHLSFNKSSDHNQIISPGDGDNLGASAENRCSDSGTSPDSEVINSVPDGPLFEKDLQNMDGSLIVKCSLSEDVSGSILLVAKSKKVKNKDKHHQVGDCSGKWNQIGGEVTNYDQGGAAPGQGMGDVSHCSDAAKTTRAKQHLKTYFSKSIPLGPSGCSRMDMENPSAATRILDDAEKNPSSTLLLEAESLDSQACDPFLENSPKCSKANGGSKSRSAVRGSPNKKDVHKKKGSKNSSHPKHQMFNANTLLRQVENHLPQGNRTSSDLGESGVQSKGSGGSMGKFQILSCGEMEHYVAPRSAWVLCDECQKWRRIPAILADQIEETNCGWTCKQNMDKDFADCSVPQEMSNSKINEELEISDASCEEDASDFFSKSNPNRSRGLFAQPSSWSLIKSNLFLHRNRKTQTIDEVMVCHCKPPSNGRMGCGAKCLNRMLNIECVLGTCPCGELCSNQQFQRRKYAQLMWFKCGKKGYGLQAVENISEGQFLIEYVGEVLDMRAYEARQKEYALKGHKHFYFMTLNGSEVIDACAKGNLGRFINHSCDPNCRTEKWMVNGEVCVGLFALRDIKKGEEVTFDYNYVRVFGAAAKKCVCGSPNCRGYIGGDPTNSEGIVQGDSDDEYNEPVMTCEDNEMTDDWNNIMNSLNNREAECTNDTSESRDEMEELTGAIGHMDTTTETHIKETLNQRFDVANSGLPGGCTKIASASQNVETVVHDKFVLDGSGCSLQLDMDKDNGKSLNGFQSASSKVESDELLESLYSSSQAKDISPQSDESKRKMKYDTFGGRDELTKSSSLAKPHRSIKKGKPKSDAGKPKFDADKGGTVVDKLNAVPSKPQRSPGLSLNNNFEAVEEKLNDLLDPQGGISKRKDAWRGYLKLLFLTAASGNNGHGEAIQSNRDLSMILDALLKTKSRTVLLDIINKNGLQMLHNIMKRYRKEFIKTPILRKLLKVLEYLAIREILTLEHISGGPLRPGVESFKDSILKLTEHADKQVHQIARNFRDRWIPRSLRKNSSIERDEARNEFRQRSLGRLLGGKPLEAIDSCDMQPLVPSGAVGNSTPDHSASVNSSGANGTKPRKRKSRWDTPPEDFPHSKPRTDVAGDVKPNIDEDIPPGFSSPCNRRSFPSDAASSPNTQLRSEAHIKQPFNIVLGTPQHRFVARVPVSYGISSSVIQQFGVIQPESLEAWTVAPGVPFYPFPPLPPIVSDKVDLPVSAAKCVPLSETVEKAEQISDTSVAHHAGQKHCRTWNSDLPEMNLSVANDQIDSHEAGGSYSLGRKYFRQQKWNNSKLAPPWVRMRSGWENTGNDNPRNCVPGVALGNGTNEFRNSYNSDEVNWIKEF